MHSSKYAVLVAAIAMAACQTATPSEERKSTSESIVGGEADSGHMAAGFINWTIEANGTTTGSQCSGALVAPRVVLTAAHCIVPANAGETFKDFIVYFGNEPQNAKTEEVFDVVKAIAHPSYSPKVHGDFDVGIMMLDRDVKGIKPARMARTLGDLMGQTVTHVGWGTGLSNNANDKSGGGEKRTIDLPITGMDDRLLQTGNGKSGICNGDSGGPAFVTVDGEEVVVGVHSFIDDNETCLGNGFSARVDRYVDFFRPLVGRAFVDLLSGAKGLQPPKYKAPSGGGGECCLNGQCFMCPSKESLDRCIGIDLDGCFSSCGQDPSCLAACGNALADVEHDPSGCGGGDDFAVPTNDGTTGCSVSIQCSDGECRCAGAKAGAVCDGNGGSPSSCDVLCRTCN